ncbi:hypothetical protein LTR95_007634 [Oleoguttula sp. CCFEE 5521]
MASLFGVCLYLLHPELSGLQALELEVHFALIRETNEDFFKKLITEISKRVQVYSVSRMVDLAPWRTFTSEVLEAIFKDDLLTFQTSVAKDSALAAIVDRAATSTGMPAGSQLVSVASLPLGCLSTDHVRFASFDLTRLDQSNIFPHENDSRVVRGTTTFVTFFASHNITPANRVELLSDAIAGTHTIVRLPSDINTANASVIDSLYAGLVDESHERLISVPVRGLFAEAKLGHHIAAAQPVQPQSNPPQATPTAVPTPIVQIQQPLAEPDPQGMAAVLKAITTPDIFRNMSGIAQVQAMLHDLTEAAVSMAQAASANLNNAQKTNTQAGNNQLAHDENMAKIANDAARQSSNQTTPDQAQYAINAAKNQAAQGTISKEQRDQLVANQLGNMKGSTAPPPPQTKPTPAVDPLRPRSLLLTIRNALNTGVCGRYMVDITQAMVVDGKLARVNTRPAENDAEEWKNGSQSIPYTPVVDRPLFYLTLRGDIRSFASAADIMYVEAQNLSFEVPADAWAKFNVASVVLTLATDKCTFKSKSTDDTANKLAVSGKLNGTVSAGVGFGGLVGKALSRIVGMKIKDLTGTGGGEVGVDWTPTDEKKEYGEKKEMTVTYYTGGTGITEVK